MIEIIAIVVGIILVGGLLFLVYFNRDPERKIPKGKTLVSPADGKVITVLDLKGQNDIMIQKGWIGRMRTITDDIGKDVTLVAISMSPMNVHVNRAPIAGKVLKVEHKTGKFMPAFLLKSMIENEKNEITMNTKIGKIKLIQVAGMMARRCIISVKEGAIVKKGDRIGRIKLGSQFDMILPTKKVKIKVKAGQKVKAGETVIADY